MKKLNNKDKIILKAVELFSTIGYDQVTVNQIIDASEISKGTFYHYFKAKNELLVYILDRSDEEFWKFLDSLPKDMAPIDKIKAFVKCVLTTHYTANDEVLNENVKQIYKTQLDLPFHRRFLLDENRTIFKVFYKLVEKAIEEDEIKAGLESKEIVGTIMMILRGVIFNWYLSSTQFNLVDKGCSFVNLYINDISTSRD